MPRIGNIVTNELCVKGRWCRETCSGNLISPGPTLNKLDDEVKTVRFKLVLIIVLFSIANDVFILSDWHLDFNSDSDCKPNVICRTTTKTEFAFMERNLLV